MLWGGKAPKECLRLTASYSKALICRHAHTNTCNLHTCLPLVTAALRAHRHVHTQCTHTCTHPCPKPCQHAPCGWLSACPGPPWRRGWARALGGPRSLRCWWRSGQIRSQAHARGGSPPLPCHLPARLQWGACTSTRPKHAARRPRTSFSLHHISAVPSWVPCTRMHGTQLAWRAALAEWRCASRMRTALWYAPGTQQAQGCHPAAESLCVTPTFAPHPTLDIWSPATVYSSCLPHQQLDFLLDFPPTAWLPTCSIHTLPAPVALCYSHVLPHGWGFSWLRLSGVPVSPSHPISFPHAVLTHFLLPCPSSEKRLRPIPLELQAQCRQASREITGRWATTDKQAEHAQRWRRSVLSREQTLWTLARWPLGSKKRERHGEGCTACSTHAPAQRTQEHMQEHMQECAQERKRECMRWLLGLHPFVTCASMCGVCGINCTMACSLAWKPLPASSTEP